MIKTGLDCKLSLNINKACQMQYLVTCEIHWFCENFCEIANSYLDSNWELKRPLIAAFSTLQYRKIIPLTNSKVPLDKFYFDRQNRGGFTSLLHQMAYSSTWIANSHSQMSHSTWLFVVVLVHISSKIKI